MRGHPGPEAAKLAKDRHRQRVSKGRITVAMAASIAKRPVGTIHSWIRAGHLGHVVEDNRRYVSREDLVEFLRSRGEAIR